MATVSTATSGRRARRRSRAGISSRQGSHQVAQKFTSTGRPRRPSSTSGPPGRSLRLGAGVGGTGFSSAKLPARTSAGAIRPAASSARKRRAGASGPRGFGFIGNNSRGNAVPGSIAPAGSRGLAGQGRAQTPATKAKPPTRGGGLAPLSDKAAQGGRIACRKAHIRGQFQGGEVLHQKQVAAVWRFSGAVRSPGKKRAGRLEGRPVHCCTIRQPR